MKYNGTQGKIKINENVDRFEIPDENSVVETTTEATTTKSARVKEQPKPKKSTKPAKRPKRSMSAMELAMADMADELTPYNPGVSILEDADEFDYDTQW